MTAKEKGALRTRIREAKKLYSGKDLQEMSVPIIRELLSHPAVSKAKTILMYYSLPDEVDTHEAIKQMAADGKTVLLPRVTDGEHMEIRRYGSEKDLKPGHYGIMEPTGEPFTDYADIDVAVVPGMGFDECGNRLGRGKGYYDRFLPKAAHAYKIGLCFGFQKFKSIPADGNDIKMDTVI